MNFRSTLKLFKTNSRIIRGYSILSQEKNLIPRVDLSWTEEKIIQVGNMSLRIISRKIQYKIYINFQV